MTNYTRSDEILAEPGKMYVSEFMDEREGQR